MWRACTWVGTAKDTLIPLPTWRSHPCLLCEQAEQVPGALPQLPDQLPLVAGRCPLMALLQTKLLQGGEWGRAWLAVFLHEGGQPRSPHLSAGPYGLLTHSPPWCVIPPAELQTSPHLARGALWLPLGSAYPQHVSGVLFGRG